MTEWKIGDKASLKSGGPIIIVVSLDVGRSMVKCAWFTKDGIVQEHVFPKEGLIHHPSL